METKFKVGEKVQHIDGEYGTIQAIRSQDRSGEQNYLVSGLRDENKRPYGYPIVAGESRLRKTVNQDKQLKNQVQ